MDNNSKGICFDRQTDDIVKFFIKENIAGFGSLKSTNEATVAIMQKFFNGCNADNKQIIMNQNEYKEIIFSLDDNSTITFGSHDPSGKTPDCCYITYKNEDETNDQEISIEVYPARFYGDNDYVYINGFEKNSEGTKDIEEKLFIKDENIFNITDASEKVLVEDVNALEF